VLEILTASYKVMSATGETKQCSDGQEQKQAAPEFEVHMSGAYVFIDADTRTAMDG
jgi:hypothetical protein